jgi:hypothetical protein
MDTKYSEKLDAVEASTVALGQSAAVSEQSKATGVYKAVCTGPQEHDRARYVELRDQIAQIETSNLITRLLYSSQLAVLKKKLNAIPLEKKWEDTVLNLVTTVGGNNMLDNHLSGSAYTAAWYMGLISLTGYTTGPALTDTMASHGGWTEDVNYSNAARPTTAWSAAAAKAKSLSAGLVFNMNGSTTIKGCFLNSVSTKSGTTGVLFSAGLFTGGDQPVVNGNTLTVTYTASV